MSACTDEDGPTVGAVAHLESKQNEKPDCAYAGRPHQLLLPKAFSTLQARLALRGWTLSKSACKNGETSFVAGCWNSTCELPDLAAVIAFADQVEVPA